MAFHPVPNAAEVAIKATLFGQEVVNTLWATKTPGSPFTTTDLGELATAVALAWDAGMLQHLSVDYKFVNVTATDKSVDGGLFAISFGDSSVSGGVGSGSLPGGSAFAVKWLTGHTGRSYRGRMFIAGLPESMVSGNEVTSDWALAVRSSANSLLTAVLGADWVPVIVSRRNDGAERTTPLTTPITIADYTDRAIDSQRRRLAGRGT